MSRLQQLLSVLVCATAPIAALADQAGTSAAGESSPAIAEITVTARRVEENLQKTPIAVSAFDEAALERSSVANVADLDMLTPNLVSTEGAGGGSGVQYFIRGTGQSDFIAALEPAVGMYVDGIYLGRVVGAAVDLAGVERVEVLRGPQGTLFGRNTIGGAVNVVSKRPDDVLAGSIDVIAGSRDNLRQRLSVNAPLAQDVAARLDVLHADQDGWGTRLLDGRRLSDKDRLAARTAVLWEPSQEASVYLTADYTRDRGTADHHYLSAVAAGIPTAILDPQYIPADPFTSWAAIDTPNDLDVRGVSADAQLRLGRWQLRSIFAFRNLDSFTAVDFDGSPLRTADQRVRTEQEQFSGELQLSTTFENSASLLLGTYYFDESVSQLIPVTILGTDIRQGNELDNSNAAVFAQLNQPLTSRLDLSLGARVTFEEKSHTFDDSVDVGGVPVPLFPVTTVKDDWTPVTWRATLDYEVTDDALVYLSYATGFRSGGFNARPVGLDEIRSFDPEKLDSIELGVKTEWFERRLRANLAGFFNTYEDIQTTALLGVSILTANAAEAEVTGFEAEITARPLEPLELSLAVGTLHTRYTELEPGAITLQRSFDLAGSPELTASAGAHLSVPVPMGGSIAFDVSYRYTSAFYFWPTNLPQERQRAYDVTNVRATYVFPGDKWQLAAFGLNVFDERYAAFLIDGSAFLGHSTRWEAAPSEWGLQVRYLF